MPASILIVDDEPAICDNLAAFLEDEGLRPQIAHSGEQALRLVAEGLRVDVCIMDLRLPGMTGTQAIVAIREIAPQTHFLVHTGSANEKALAELARTGLEGVPVFHKPIRDMARFSDAIRAVSPS